MTRLAALLACATLVACDSVGPIATLGATRLAWEAMARGDGWSATIDDPEVTLTVDGRAATVPVTYEDSSRGRRFSGSFQGAPFTLLLAPGPCSLGPQGTPTRYEFAVTLTLAGETRSGCGSRGWLAR